MKNIIGKNLKYYRKKSHYSLEEVSNALDISIEEILLIEDGEKIPSINELIRFSEFYNVSLDDLTKNNFKFYEDKDFMNINIGDSINIHKNKINKSINKGKEVFIKSFSSEKRMDVELVFIISLFIVTIVYLGLGFGLGTSKIWDVYWVLYLLPFIISSGFESFLYKNPCKFNIIFLLTFVYLLIGMLMNIWHPTWIIFLGIPLFYSFIGLIKKFNTFIKNDFIKEKCTL